MNVSGNLRKVGCKKGHCHQQVVTKFVVNGAILLYATATVKDFK